MPIHFRCPHCDKLLAIGTRKGGAQINCPLCDQVVVVPRRTDMELPTTTVVPPDLPPAWWTDGPAADANAWWIAAASPSPAPEAAITTTPAPSIPPPLPEAIVSAPALESANDLLGFGPAINPTISSPQRAVSTAQSFSRTHVLILAGGAGRRSRPGRHRTGPAARTHGRRDGATAGTARPDS